MILTVVVPVYNNAKEIENCLSALTNQQSLQLGREYEIVVVNDGSQDQSENIIKRFPVKLIRHKRNLGRVLARLSGANAASTPFLLFVDARVVVAQDFIANWISLPPYPVILAGNQSLFNPKSFLAQSFWLIRQIYYGKHYFPKPLVGHWITKDNFRKSPKGLGALFISKKLWSQIQPQAHKKFNYKQFSDDTALLFNLVDQNIPIWRSNLLCWKYQGREQLIPTIQWLHQRGVKFASHYLKANLIQDLIAILLVLVSIFLWKLSFIQLLFLITLILVVASYKLWEVKVSFHHFCLLLLVAPVILFSFTSGILRYLFQERGQVWLTIISFILLGSYVVINWSILQTINNINWLYLLALLPLYGLFYFSNGLFLKWIIEAFSLRVPLTTSFSVANISSFANSFLPFRSGTAWRAIYLKQKFHYPYKKFLLALLANYLIVFHINSLIGLLAVLALTSSITSTGQTVVVWLLVSVWLLTMSLLWTPQLAKKWLSKIPAPKFIFQGIRGWRLLQQRPALLIKLIFLAAGNLFISALMFGLQLKVLGLAAEINSTNWQSFTTWLLVASISSLSLLLSITPSALGIKEGLFAISSHWLGLAPAFMVAVSLLDRLLSALVLLILFPISWKLLHHQSST